MIILYGLVGVIVIVGVIYLIGYVETKRKEEQAMRDATRLRQLTEKFGKQIANRIKSREVWQGMTEEMVLASLGRPLDIDEKVLKTKSKRIFKYNQLTSRSYGTKITIEDGIVVGWDVK